MSRLGAFALALLATYAGGLVVRAGYPFGLFLVGSGACALGVAVLSRTTREVR